MPSFSRRASGKLNQNEANQDHNNNNNNASRTASNKPKENEKESEKEQRRPFEGFFGKGFSNIKSF